MRMAIVALGSPAALGWESEGTPEGGVPHGGDSESVMALGCMKGTPNATDGVWEPNQRVFDA